MRHEYEIGIDPGKRFIFSGILPVSTDCLQAYASLPRVEPAPGSPKPLLDSGRAAPPATLGIPNQVCDNKPWQCIVVTRDGEGFHAKLKLPGMWVGVFFGKENTY